MLRLSKASLALVSLALVGCGGGGASAGGPTNRVAFSGLDAYNGDASALTARPTSGSSLATTNVYVQSGARTFALRLPAIMVDAGQSFEIGAETRASYDEDSTSYWVGSGGKVEVVVVRNGQATLRLSGLTFVPRDDIQNNPARGGFVVNGQLTRVAFDLDDR